MKKERIGILGGTFNPVHCGHLTVAAAVQRRFSLDRVLFIPSSIPPHKSSKGIASPDERLKMVELAVRGRSKFAPSDIEIKARGKSYSIQTLKKIKKIYPGAWLFFILGVDAFLEIETWREWERVLGECLLIVVTRPGYRLKEAEDVLGDDYCGRVCWVSNLDRIREELFLGHRIFILPIGALDISSTEIRERIGEGRSIRGFVPAAVEDYIEKHGLYRDPKPRKIKSPRFSRNDRLGKPGRG